MEETRDNLGIERPRIQRRKKQHLNICLDLLSPIEYSTGHFDECRLAHRALPETNLEDISLNTKLLNYNLASPLFISSMTGGVERGAEINRDLASVAERVGMAFSVGSIRVLFKHPEQEEQFSLKEVAPSVPVIANIGAVQLLELKQEYIFDCLIRLRFDAIFIHLNPAQELFQQGGDENFVGILDAIRLFCRDCPVPVIVKETGAGIAPRDALALLEAGAYAIDIAGAGGTNWLKVESVENADPLGEEFNHWGYSTAVLLKAYNDLRLSHPQLQDRYWASGGIRSASDALKARALGATFVGMARPLIQELDRGGQEGLELYLNNFHKQLRRLLLLCGISSWEEAQSLSLYVPSHIRDESLFWQKNA